MVLSKVLLATSEAAPILQQSADKDGPKRNISYTLPHGKVREWKEEMPQEHVSPVIRLWWPDVAHSF